MKTKTKTKTLKSRRLDVGVSVVAGVCLLSAGAAQAQVTGSGTAGWIPKWTDPTVLSNSVIIESAGGNIGIGTLSPASKLTVVGSTAIVLQADNTSTAANAYGVQGKITATAPGAGSAGVRGINSGTASASYGVYGTHGGPGIGVYGYAHSGRGVYGSSSSGTGAIGVHTATTGTNPGVQGTTNSTAANAAGVLGQVASTAPGVDSAGVRGINNGTGSTGSGVYGSHAGTGTGVYGTGSTGVYGRSESFRGVEGYSRSGTGVVGTSDGYEGVWGYSTSGTGVRGSTFGVGNNGVWGVGRNGATGTAGTSDTGPGIYGESTSGNAGYFNGNVEVSGTINKAATAFKIDHPLAPAQKYLSHSVVESPDMMNIYNGTARTDARGNATVIMPKYFSALNRDFRYQLTCIGAPALVYIAQKIRNNRFKIGGGKPGMEVSWQVTGVRQDAYARDHRIKVEQDKGKERGFYLYPAGFGQPKEKMVGYAQHPQLQQPGKEKLARRPAAAKP